MGCDDDDDDDDDDNDNDDDDDNDDDNDDDDNDDDEDDDDEVDCEQKEEDAVNTASLLPLSHTDSYCTDETSNTYVMRISWSFMRDRQCTISVLLLNTV